MRVRSATKIGPAFLQVGAFLRVPRVNGETFEHMSNLVLVCRPTFPLKNHEESQNKLVAFLDFSDFFRGFLAAWNPSGCWSLGEALEALKNGAAKVQG